MFYDYHFAVECRDKLYRDTTVSLHKTEASAMKEANFMVHNRDSVTVYRLGNDCNIAGRIIARSSKKVKLVKIKEEGA